ncbi:MAG TPA: DUF998 domain-containing protein [Microlunatus sp.]
MSTITSRTRSTGPATGVGTAALLAAGVVAGPLYVTVSLAQALTRPGFDLTRHPWSALATGDVGWLQVMNLIVTGVLVIAFAVGLRRVLTEVRAMPSSRWAPALIALYGLGLVAAGIFRADPVAGFPVGTPASTTISGHGMVHLMAGAVGFLCLTAACLLLARRFAPTSRAWAIWTAGAGIVFLGAFVGIASGAGSRTTIAIFVMAVLIIWTWFTTFALHLLRASR